MRTCIRPDGIFRFGIHKPSYRVRNLRDQTSIGKLGEDYGSIDILNRVNYPDTDVDVAEADWIYEISNPFSFRGSTFIGKGWADRSAENIDSIMLPASPSISMSENLASRGISPDLIESLPRPLLLCLAVTSTDPDELVRLARLSCTFVDNPQGEPDGFRYRRTRDGDTVPEIPDHDLFEAVANNPALPDAYKIAMVIRPGAQGDSEIVGDHHDGENSHVYEYLRRNSYIGGGHYAANMADDAIRYSIDSLTPSDMNGLRQLYYQRSYVRLADLLTIPLPPLPLDEIGCERLRFEIVNHPEFNHLSSSATLWGWNFGFDFAPSGYRLHASHQQIHQQYSLIPATIAGGHAGATDRAEAFLPFSSGDMIEEVMLEYRRRHKSEFFSDYLMAMNSNIRMDNREDRDPSLVVWQDDRVILFVPKAQTSQWELNIMTMPDQAGYWPGNILETDSFTRSSIDKALLKAQQALAARGARMITSIEYSKRFNSKETTQPLLYSLIPKLPHSPGAFSEAQLRFINGHYPEDFAAVCRQALMSP